MTSLRLLIVSSLLLSGMSHAGNLLDLSVLDRDTGATLQPLASEGKLYIVGVPGHRYAVRLANHSSERVMAVLSVDGVNAVSGETANPLQTGYVLDPYQTTEIDGWRKSQSEVAQFNFTALSDSYAARTGRPGNVGVIGVAVFRERPMPRLDDKLAARDAPASGPARAQHAAPPPPMSAAPATAGAGVGALAKAESAAAPPAQADNAISERRARASETLGTGHGAREASYVSYTQFERAGNQPYEVVSLWYDSYRNLQARGVIPATRPIAVEPQPFPHGFVPDPAS